VGFRFSAWGMAPGAWGMTFHFVGFFYPLPYAF
jgi:hypothetical protein